MGRQLFFVLEKYVFGVLEFAFLAEMFGRMDYIRIVGVVILAAVILCILSIEVSMRIVERKEF